jgi:hypothetical protein
VSVDTAWVSAVKIKIGREWVNNTAETPRNTFKVHPAVLSVSSCVGSFALDVRFGKNGSLGTAGPWPSGDL